jgi:hypothetical protein
VNGFADHVTLLCLAAWYQTVRGKPADALKLNESAPVPKPASGEVLIRGEHQVLFLDYSFEMIAKF